MNNLLQCHSSDLCAWQPFRSPLSGQDRAPSDIHLNPCADSTNRRKKSHTKNGKKKRKKREKSKSTNACLCNTVLSMIKHFFISDNKSAAYTFDLEIIGEI